ncbi:hypothetical protein K402DRAFT_422098 [Aulographum hederae CBS 113979]|uniref:Inositol-pentakisphosphate 2-kinase n=1 Tax=Aulographum hederae CBS 113979 TaxID=1176131 RepID=A0A6G1GXM1_9PEZI|nr:hypothetical protein K402DRAFT_422098 [Aulographum hederae CBS 113979]
MDDHPRRTFALFVDNAFYAYETGEDSLSLLAKSTSNAVMLQHFNEGNANVLYTVVEPTQKDAESTLPPGSVAVREGNHASESYSDAFMTLVRRGWTFEARSRLQSMLLRVRKNTVDGHNPLSLEQQASNDLHYVPTATIYEDLQNQITPLLTKDYTIDGAASWVPPQSTHHISPELLKRLDQSLRSIERRPKHKSKFLNLTETKALLVEDMRAGPGQFTIDFKLKWLSQSPFAPPLSRRCRTCALSAMRHAVDATSKVSCFCPLTLVDPSPDKARLHSFLKGLVLRSGSSPKTSTLDEKLDMMENTAPSKLAHFLLNEGGEGHAIVKRLAALQIELDPPVMETAMDSVQPPSITANKNKAMAMTFRDCSLFIRADWNFNNVEARLADLDMKSNEPEKVVEWTNKEKALVDGGWYQLESPICAWPRIQGYCANNNAGGTDSTRHLVAP